MWSSRSRSPWWAIRPRADEAFRGNPRGPRRVRGLFVGAAASSDGTSRGEGGALPGEHVAAAGRSAWAGLRLWRHRSEECVAAVAEALGRACGRKRGAMGPGGAVSVHPRPRDGPATHHAPRGRRPAQAHRPRPRIGVVCGEPGRCLIARMWIWAISKRCVNEQCAMPGFHWLMHRWVTTHASRFAVSSHDATGGGVARACAGGHVEPRPVRCARCERGGRGLTSPFAPFRAVTRQFAAIVPAGTGPATLLDARIVPAGTGPSHASRIDGPRTDLPVCGNRARLPKPEPHFSKHRVALRMPISDKIR